VSEQPEFGYAVAEQRQQLAETKTQLFVAGCLSAVIPGAGHFFRKLKMRGAIWIAGLAVYLVLTVCLRPWSSSDGFLGAIVVGSILLVAAGIDAAFARTEEDHRATKFAIALYACIALTASAFENITIWKLAGFRNTTMYSAQMDPTIKNGETVVFDTRAYRNAVPHRGDIVTLDNTSNLNGAIKRVVAIPGDTIEERDGHVILNNVQIQESYVPGGQASIDVSASNDPDLKRLYNFEPVKLGHDQYFVMGDNRALSYDSRQTGPVKRNAISGKALYLMNQQDSGRDGRPLD